MDNQIAAGTPPDPNVDTDVEPLIQDDAETDAEVLPFRYKITAFGKDYPIDALVKRIKSGAISIPRFQRQYVWKKAQADRFIESLLLGLPVPGIFLAEGGPEGSLLVLDGHQRLETLRRFYDNDWNGGRFALSSVQDGMVGLTYDGLRTDDQTRLDDSVIPATVVRQDEPSDDQSSVFFVFERINTGGTPLAPQEIRAALYQGRFNDLLARVNERQAWRAVVGRPSPRLKDQELVLRFFALYYERAQYRRPMKEFLNGFMGRHRNLTHLSEHELETRFDTTVALIQQTLGSGAFRPKAAINAAVADSVMVGLAVRLQRGDIQSPDSVTGAYIRLLENIAYQDAYTRATADEERVQHRIDLAISAFSGVV